MIPAGMREDRELLELAACAAGIAGRYIEWDGPMGQQVAIVYHGEDDDPDAGPETYWNPLADDGDALRLARGLRMTLAHEPSRGGWSAGAVIDDEFRWLSHDEDDRRAITLAAAAMAPNPTITGDGP